VHRQEGAALDVGVQHREGAARQLRHGYAPLRPPRALAAYAPSFSHSAIKILLGLTNESFCGAEPTQKLC
jgi:hypothetical protein